MKILLAEDERPLSRALCAILTKNKYTVDPVYDGEEALVYLENAQYDAAILDIMMPKMDGLKVLAKLREKNASLPVLILSAKSEVDDKVLGLDTGANDYLTKPFAAAELLARLRAITRSPEAQGDPALSFGNIRLDRAAFKLTSPFGSFTLANKEYQMMEMLMRSPGKLISAEQFIEQIWGFDSDAENTIVWVYVSYLRKKLTALQATVEIRARRNLGYFLVDKAEEARE